MKIALGLYFRFDFMVDLIHRHSMTIEPVGSYISKWGEGPIWWEGFLYYVDIESHKIIRFDTKSGYEMIFDVGQRVGTVVPREEGGLVWAGDNGLYFLNEFTGESTPITDPEPDKENNRFNDGKCSPDGRLFAGTISLKKVTGDASLYRLDPDHTLHTAHTNVTNSNGLAWNASGDTLYYIDTPRREVLAFDYDQTTGNLSNERVAFATDAIDASPDGMTIDAQGNLWIAFCHGACVVQYKPTGELLQKIDIPCLETTACAFGGHYFNELYITTGVHKTEEEEHAGRLFVVKDLGIEGVRSNAFKG